MKIFNDWRGLPSTARGASVALGNFDGVHLGHAGLLRAAHAARPDTKLAVLTFEPHPREFFRPQDPPFRLTLSAERAAALAALGRGDSLRTAVRRGVLPSLRRGSSSTRCCMQGVGAAHLACGADFAFGHRRGGDTALLARRAEALGHGPDHRAADRRRAGADLLHPHPPPAAGRLPGTRRRLAGPALLHPRRGDAWRCARPHHRLSHRQYPARRASGAGARRVCRHRPAAGWRRW